MEVGERRRVRVAGGGCYEEDGRRTHELLWVKIRGCEAKSYLYTDWLKSV